MLDTLRKGASSWVSKLLMILLIVSFAAWGIAGVFSNQGFDVVARVGDAKITSREFDIAWRRELNNFQRQMGGALTREQAISFGLPQRVTARMVTDAAIEQEARQLGLGISNSETDALIARDPSLKRPDGAFDPNYARMVLENNGWTSTTYFSYLKREAIRQQLIGSVAANVPPPETLVQVADRYLNETRKVTYFILDDAKAGEIAAPDEETLAKFYESNKSGFRTVEMRSLNVALLTPDVVAKPAEVSDADAKAYYDANLSKYGAPEQRRVEQLPFDAVETAEAAAAELKAGKSFDDLVAARNLKNADIDLGLMSKDAFVDSAVADAAFGLAAAGDVSGVVKARVRPVILHLVEVKPGSVKSFDEVRDDIKLTIAKGRAADTIAKQRDDLEDLRAGGTKLVEIAKQFGMKPPVSITIDRNGNSADGKPVTDVPEIAKIAKAGFAGDIGAEIDLITLPGGGFAIVELAKIDPARDRPLADVHDGVVERWRQEEIRNRIAKLGDELIAKIQSGTAIADVASGIGATIATTDAFKRGKGVEPLTDAAVAAAFSGPEGYVTSTATKDGKRMVMQVSDVTVPAFMATTPEAKQVADGLTSDMRATAVDQMVRQLRSDYGVQINQGLINQIIGSR